MTEITLPEPGNDQKLDKVQTQKARWATRKMTVKSSKTKRKSLLNRMQHKRNASEKSTGSAGSGDHPPFDEQNPDGADAHDEDDKSETSSDDESENRTLFFNIPLPDEMLDEDGLPVNNYPRNKIRTAKYTPLSFVPKNLWFQFHNVANIFFLFLVILVIFPIFGAVNPGLNAVPLIFIIFLTAVKDAIEDYRRTILDMELNNAPVHRLVNWNNVNVELDNVSTWRRFKKANSRFFGVIWHTIESIWSKKARQQLAERRNAITEDDEPRPSVETQRTRMSMRQSISSPFGNRNSTHSQREDIQMTPVPSPSPHNIRIELPDDADKRRATAINDMKTDLINYHHPANGARFKKDVWKNIVVGDFVRIYNDDEFPADIIILSTSDPDGACYVETKNLDGETNLKVRQALRSGRSMQHARDCERAEFRVESEAPQPNLYKYNGAVKWSQPVPGYEDDELEEMTEPVTIDNLLLRGCNLRNTEWVLGVVVFTGHDTKIMMNA
ncbi:hypothetical protein Golomagni_05567, partial [Golovinomyces magnicellulatus]